METLASYVHLLRESYHLPLYLGACLLISQPIILGVWGFLYTPSGFPTGEDAAFHTFFVLRMIETKNPLIPYSAFPEIKNSYQGYYNSLLHIILSVFTVVSSAGNVSFSTALNTIKAFMFATYIIGILAYALLLKTIFDRAINTSETRDQKDPAFLLTYNILLILSFGIFIYSTTPLIKTFRDGTYGEIFAIWCIMPIYLCCLLRNRWIVAGILLAGIASAHNLSLVMALVPTIFYLFFNLLFSRASLKKSWVFVVTSVLLSLPALIFFYLPIAMAAINGTNPALGFPWSRQDIMLQITDNLYYAGVISSSIILLLSYRLLGWLSVWGLSYFYVALSSNVYNVRFGRELCLIFGIMVGICAALIIYKIVMERFRHLFHNYKGRTLQIVGVAVITLVVLAMSYGYFANRIRLETDPIKLEYISPALTESNRYFLNINSIDTTRMPLTVEDNLGNETSDNKPTIVVFGQDPWLKPMVYGKFSVLTVAPKQDAQYLQRSDRIIDLKLIGILNDPNSTEAMDTIKEYNVHYIYISDFLPNAWYSPSDLSEKSELNTFQVDSHSNYIKLEKQYIGDEGERFRIYSINQNIVNRNIVCSSGEC